MDKLEEIFKLQQELNDKIFVKQGILDPLGQSGDPLRMDVISGELAHGNLGPNRLPNIWMRNYLKALTEEAKELDEELLWKWWSNPSGCSREKALRSGRTSVFTTCARDSAPGV